MCCGAARRHGRAGSGGARYGGAGGVVGLAAVQAGSSTAKADSSRPRRRGQDGESPESAGLRAPGLPLSPGPSAARSLHGRCLKIYQQSTAQTGPSRLWPLWPPVAACEDRPEQPRFGEKMVQTRSSGRPLAVPPLCAPFPAGARFEHLPAVLSGKNKELLLCPGTRRDAGGLLRGIGT